MSANKNHPYYQEQVNPKEDVEYIKKILQRALNNWHYITLCVLLMLTIAFCINKYSTPVYSISTSVLIKEPNDVTNSVSELLYGTPGIGGSSTNLENESILLKALSLVEETLKDLNMNVSYYKEDKLSIIELYKNSPIRVTIDNTSQIIPYGISIQCIIKDKQFYTLETDEGDFNNLKAIIKKEDADEPAFNFTNRLLPFGEYVVVDGFRFKIELFDNSESIINEGISFKINDYKSLARRYKGKLKIEAYTLGSSILKVSIEENNPDKGIDFLNQHIENYITGGLEEKDNIAANTISFINDQLFTIRDSLSAIEGRLENFKESTTSIDLSVEGNQLYNNIQEIEKQKSFLEINMKYLENIKAYISAGDQLENIAIPSSFGITDPTLNGLIEQLVQIQLESKMMSSSVSDKNPVWKINQQKIEILKTNIIENINNLQQGNKILLGDLNRKIRSISGSLKSLPAAEREKINIQRTHDLSESLYVFLMEKRAEAGISKASNTVDFKLVDGATIDGGGPIKPRSSLNYALALFVGLLIPMGFIFVTDMFNDKIRSKEELLEMTSLPFLGIVARSKGKGEFMVSQNLRSAASESFRNIRSNLRYMSENDTSGKIYLISSSISGEGKTYCANNLAYLFSNFGKKTILVNTDMRKPNFYEDAGVKADYGLSHYLAGIRSKKDIIKKSKFDNLDVISAGNTPPNPSELLISDKISRLMSELKEEYSYIILDTPPVGIISDALDLMKKADVNIIVVRQNYTPRSLLNNINVLNEQKVFKNMAVVLNDVNLEKMNYGYGYNSYAYYFEEKP